jgi:hypothetical protein
VHQEIGYAVALNIPVLPVTIGSLPCQMIQDRNALEVCIDTDDLTAVRAELSSDRLGDLAEAWADQRYATYACADDPPERAQMIASYADSVRSMGEYGRVRQRGALSSFHIPNEATSNRIWRQRYGGYDRGKSHCTHQRNERLALEKHSKEEGCRIIIDPSITYEQWGAHARKVRLETLLRFLGSEFGMKAQVAINTDMPRAESLTIVGDWFLAESVFGTIQGGYKQTIFTRHAPSVARRVKDFDVEFAELLAEKGWTPDSSRVLAMQELSSLIDEIEKGLERP